MHFEAEDGVIAALLRLMTTQKGTCYFQKTLFISWVNNTEKRELAC